MCACVCVYMCVPVRVCVIHNRTATRLRPHEPNRRIPSIPTTTNHDQQQIPNSRAVFERAMEELPDSERTEKVRTFIRAHVCMYMCIISIPATTTATVHRCEHPPTSTNPIVLQVFSAFAQFEERHREYERARVIYKVRRLDAFVGCMLLSCRYVRRRPSPARPV